MMNVSNAPWLTFCCCGTNESENQNIHQNLSFVRPQLQWCCSYLRFLYIFTVISTVSTEADVQKELFTVAQKQVHTYQIN